MIEIESELEFEYYGNLLYLDAILTKAFKDKPTDQRKKMMFALNDIRHYVHHLQMERRGYKKVINRYKTDRTTLILENGKNR